MNENLQRPEQDELTSSALSEIEALERFAARFQEMRPEQQREVKRTKQALTPSLLEAMAILKEAEGLEITYIRARETLRTVGISKSELDTMVTRRLEERTKKLEALTATEQSTKPAQRTVKEALGDAPGSSLVVPRGYSLSLKGIDWVGDQPRLVTNSPVLITGLLRSVESGALHVRVSYWRQQWEHGIVSRGTVASQAGLLSLAKQGFPAHAGNASAVAAYLAAFEAENLSSLPLARTTNRMGWQGQEPEEGFLVGRLFITPKTNTLENLDLTAAPPEGWSENMIGFSGLDVGDNQLADGFHRRGTLEGWMETVKLAAPFPRAMLPVYAVFAVPLLHLLDCPNFIVDMPQRTTLGKTTVSRLAASALGKADPRSVDTVLISWDNSRAYFDRAPAVINDLPLMLDDSKHLERKAPDLLADMVYKVTQGRTSGKAALEGQGLAGARTWRTVLVSNGERPLISYSRDGGAKARVLTLSGLPFEGEDDTTRLLTETINTEALQHYGHAGPLWLQWLLQNRDQLPVWQQRYRERKEVLARAAGSTVGARLAAYGALISFTGELLHEAFAMMGKPLTWVYTDPVTRLWEELTADSQDPVHAEQALRETITWAHANKASFWREATTDRQPVGGWLGRWDFDDKNWNQIAFDPVMLRQHLERSGYKPEEILDAWRQSGWILVAGSRRGHTRQVTLNGGKVYMVVIPRIALQSLDRGTTPEAGSNLDAEEVIDLFEETGRAS